MRMSFYDILFRLPFSIAHNQLSGMRMYVRLSMQGSQFSDPLPSSWPNTFGKNFFQILFVVLIYNDIFSTVLALKVACSFKEAISLLKWSITMPTRIWVATHSGEYTCGERLELMSRQVKDGRKLMPRKEVYCKGKLGVASCRMDSF